MSTVSRRVELLDNHLARLPLDSEAMIVSELDGFVAGILVCPELILPSEWLPKVWGGEAEPVFESSRELGKLVDLVMRHFNAVANDLQHGRYAAIFDVDKRHEETLWELWIDGFENAVQLRPESWTAMLQGDEDTCTALAGLLLLARISSGDSDLPEEEIDELTKEAPDLIPYWVQILSNWRVQQHIGTEPGKAAPSFGKAGRNEPCPCGSGKKYKKCCGFN
jgi:uncharacterized protein